MDKKEETMKVDMGAEGSKTVNINFPSNSRKQRQEKEEQEETRRVERVVTTKVVQRKKTAGRRFLEMFVGDSDNGGSIMGYIIHDVLVPAAKDTIYDMVKGGLEMKLFGEDRGSRSRRSGSRDRDRSYVSYDRMSSRDRDRQESRRRGGSDWNRARHNFDDIVIASRGEAEEVVDNLVDLIIDYGQATVADLYQLVGINESYTDRKYGWTDLRSSSISRYRNEGYILNLPKPTLLD